MGVNFSTCYVYSWYTEDDLLTPWQMCKSKSNVWPRLKLFSISTGSWACLFMSRTKWVMAELSYIYIYFRLRTMMNSDVDVMLMHHRRVHVLFLWLISHQLLFFTFLCSSLFYLFFSFSFLLQFFVLLFLVFCVLGIFSFFCPQVKML